MLSEDHQDSCKDSTRLLNDWSSLISCAFLVSYFVKTLVFVINVLTEIKKSVTLLDTNIVYIYLTAT